VVRPPLRVVVVTPNLEGRSVASSATVILRSLGHEVLTSVNPPDDLDQIDPPADVAIFEAGPHPVIIREIIARLRTRPHLASMRVLVCLGVSAVSGLDPEGGGDDFILMPLNADELGARLALLRDRDRWPTTQRPIQYGEIALDLEIKQAFIDGRGLGLTPYEFLLLRFLVERPRRVFTREELMARVLGYRRVGRTRTVDMHVRNLRAKLVGLGDCLEGVRGVGYKFTPRDSAGGRDARGFSGVNPTRAASAG
jgi:DNA-binding response OmpR family regulator